MCDFDDNTNWIDVTVVGSAYEEEMSEDGKQWRHRRMPLGPRGYGLQEPWKRGRAPK